MINLYRSKPSIAGAATLIFTVVMMLLTTLIIIFAANSGQMQTKTTANLTRNNQAFQAAEAGLEFGINYLQRNSSTITANPSGGYINYSDSSTTNISLANNSRFSVVYTNPTANNYNLIKITSTGTSDDNTSTRTVSQLVQFGSMLSKTPTVPLSTKSNTSMSGSAQVTNSSSNTTIKTAGSASLSGSAKTVLNSGTSSTAGNIQSDIVQNDATLSGLSQNDLFSTYFGLPTSMVKNNVSYYYSNNVSTNYSSTLSGKSGTSIWIDQTGGTATINGFTTIGSSSNPVLLILNGNLALGGIVIFYGMLYVTGNITTDSFNFDNINGALINTGTISLVSNAQLTYSPSILTNTQNQSSMSYYAKVPGSWKDF